jgi:hypothetical protein
MTESVAKQKIRVAGELKSLRGTWESHWQEIGDRMYPRKADFTAEKTPGEKRNQQIYDSSPVIAVETLAAGMHGMLTNPASQWFQLVAEDTELNKVRAVQEWLSIANRVMTAEFNRPEAGFASAMHEDYMEYVAFGTSIMMVFEHPTRNGVLFQARPLAECCLMENDIGQIDTIYREFKWTVRQMVQRWGRDKVSEEVRKKYDAKQQTEMIKVLHVMEPRETRDAKKKSAAHKAFASTYIEVATAHILEDGGFDEQAGFASRFYKGSMEVYGRSPGSSTLPDVKMLNEMYKVTLKAAQKMIDPPLMVPDDGFLNPVRTVPGGINMYRSGTQDRIEPLLTGGNIQIDLALMNEVRDRISKAFFIDQLQLQQGPQMTATEVMQRTEEKLRLMGPVLGRVQTEKLGPMIDRVFAILLRQKRIPTPPKELSGKNLKVEYTSPLARAQKQLEAQGILRTVEVMSPFVQADPSIMQKINGDRMLDHVAITLFGMDPTLIRTDEEVAAMRQQAQQEMQTMKMLNAAEVGGRAAQSLAQAEATSRG